MMKSFLRMIGILGFNNLGVVSEGKVFRSAQPNYYCLPWELNIKTVLDLQDNSDHENANRRNTTELYGIRYLSLRLNILSELTVEDFDLVVQTLSAPENQPILVHCQFGRDRTGIACAAYRLSVDQWSLEEALEEFDAYGGGGVIDTLLKKHLRDYADAKGLG